MAIHLYGCESQVYTPAQITRFNALHYKVLRQIFQVKNSFYHRVLQPSDAECSNAFLLQLPYVHAPRLLINSQRISVQRLRYLGHILRHFDSLEHKISFNTSHSLRTISSPFRIGRPSVHWPEIAMSEPIIAIFSSTMDILPPTKKCTTLCTRLPHLQEFNPTLALP